MKKQYKRPDVIIEAFSTEEILIDIISGSETTTKGLNVSWDDFIKGNTAMGMDIE